MDKFIGKQDKEIPNGGKAQTNGGEKVGISSKANREKSIEDEDKEITK